MISVALEQAATLCKQFEGFREKPYLCPAGVPTIGYGSTRYLDGRRVTLDDPPLGKEEANLLLIQTLLNTYMVGVLTASPVLFNYPHALAAITDFAYNLGVSRYKSSTLKKRIDAEDFQSSVYEIKKWVYGGGRRLNGLVRRREAEAELLLKEI